MPTKYNRAGQQQPYVPAGNGDESGEYRDNAYGGNSTEQKTTPSFPKQESKPLGVKVETTDGSKKDISTIKSSYEGKGNQNLQEELKRRMGKSSNYKNVVDQIKDANDEYSGIIADYYKANEDVQLKFGKNLSSRYQIKITRNWYSDTTNIDKTVSVGQGIFTDTDYYSKGGVFFHESGHALDNTFEKGNVNSNWSCDYKSEKYGVALKDMINKEIRENLNEDAYKQLVEEIKQEREKLKSSVWSEAQQKELDDVKAELNSDFKVLDSDATNTQLKKEANNLLNDLADLRQKWYQNMGNNELSRLYTERREQYNKKQQELYDYQDNFYKTKFPNHFALREKKSNLEDEKYNSHNKISGPIGRKYGDIADMVQGSLYKDLEGVNMGHSLGYWTSNTRGKEAFAEIMSAKATNQESYEVLKRYIPKSIEIFDEIIDKIRNKGKQAL